MVLEALNSGWVAPVGPDLDLFETEVAKVSGRLFGVALSSGTAALQLGLLALHVQPGDVVVCASMTFVATANAVMHVGAIPVFVDSEIETGNISLPLLRLALEGVAKSGRRLGAVIPVDLLGKAANHTEIVALCEEFSVPVLVDAAESLGAKHRGRPSASYGQSAVLSFNGNKIATTSGGGMFLTDDEILARRVRFLSTQAREPEDHYEHREVGYNFRLSNVLAALGRAQVTRLPDMISKRRETRNRYRELFHSVEGVEVFGGEDSEDNCWLTAVVIDEGLVRWAPQNLAQHLMKAGIESRPLWKPMHMQPLYKDRERYIDGSSESLFRSGLTLPSGSSMSDSEWRRIESSIRSFIKSAKF
jgi:dTDP-4-amino-4,6-dideoxygalactose transaminase